MVDVLKIPVEVVNIIIEYIREIRQTCFHCGFVGDIDWFVDGNDNCEECCDFIEGNGILIQ